MNLSGILVYKLAVIVLLFIFVSCSNFTTINFKPELSSHINDQSKFLYYFEETLFENSIDVITKYIDTSQTYIYEISYFHPPGEPISVSKDILMHYQVKGQVTVVESTDGRLTVDFINLKWNKEGPTETGIIDAFNKEIINEFKEKIEKL